MTVMFFPRTAGTSGTPSRSISDRAPSISAVLPRGHGWPPFCTAKFGSVVAPVVVTSTIARVTTVAGTAHRITEPREWRTGRSRSRTDSTEIARVTATREHVERVAGEAGALAVEEHDDGPVPEVDAVRDAAEPDEGTQLEHAAAFVRAPWNENSTAANASPKRVSPP